MKNCFLKILLAGLVFINLCSLALSAEQAYIPTNLKKSEALFNQILANIRFEKRRLIVKTYSGPSTSEKERVLREVIYEFFLRKIFPTVGLATDPLHDDKQIPKDILQRFYLQSKLDDESYLVEFVEALHDRLKDT